MNQINLRKSLPPFNLCFTANYMTLWMSVCIEKITITSCCTTVALHWPMCLHHDSTCSWCASNPRLSNFRASNSFSNSVSTVTYCYGEWNFCTYNISGLNAQDKTPMYEMLLIYVFGVWGFGVGASIFCFRVLGNGILSLAFCHEIYINGLEPCDVLWETLMWLFSTGLQITCYRATGALWSTGIDPIIPWQLPTASTQYYPLGMNV